MRGKEGEGEKFSVALLILLFDIYHGARHGAARICFPPHFLRSWPVWIDRLWTLRDKSTQAGTGLCNLRISRRFCWPQPSISISDSQQWKRNKWASIRLSLPSTLRRGNRWDPHTFFSRNPVIWGYTCKRTHDLIKQDAVHFSG